jgi:hypothetical protein
MFLAALALTAPLVMTDLPGNDVVEASLFPELVIRKVESEHEWAFAIEEGTLTCIAMSGEKYVFFAEIPTAEEMGEFGNMKLPRSVVVTTNPLAFLATVENRELYLPFDTLETLIKRLAPFETMGRALCDQDGEQQKKI